MARHADVPAGHTVCGLEVPDDPAGTTQLVPPDELPPVSPDGGGGLVLAVADGTPRDPLTRRRHPIRASAAMLSRLAWNKFALVFAILLAAVITGFCLLLGAGYPVIWVQALTHCWNGTQSSLPLPHCASGVFQNLMVWK